MRDPLSLCYILFSSDRLESAAAATARNGQTFLLFDTLPSFAPPFLAAREGEAPSLLSQRGRDRIRSCYYVDERKRGKELRLLFRESFHSFDPRPSSSPSPPPMIRWERTRDLILELLQAFLLPFGLWSFFALALGTFFIARRGEETRKKGRRGGWEG